MTKNQLISTTTEGIVDKPKNDDFVKIRSILKNNAEAIINALSSYRQSLKNHAQDLFFQDNSANIRILSGLNLNTPLIPKFELLLAEKESLGIYISQEPLDQFKDILEWSRDVCATDNLYLVLVEKIRKIFTKANQMMIAVQVSVIGEPMEMLVFPKNALRISPLLEEKQVYWVTGQLKIPKSLFVDKKKQEHKGDIKEETEGKKEGGFEMQEYKELPKLAVENLVLFNQGPMSIIEMDRLTNQRQEALKEVKWSELLLNPEIFYQHQTTNDTNVKTENNHKTNKKQIDNTLKNNPDFEPNQVKPTILALPASFGANKLNKLKSYLLTEPISGTIPISLEVQHQNEWKKVKGVFYIEEPIAKKVLDGVFE